MNNSDPSEIEKFNRHAAAWWDPNGAFKPLHKFNPVRLAFVQEQIAAHYPNRPWADISVLDIGCGGGLIAEPIARLGAKVTGIDASERNIAVATQHAATSGVNVDYRHAELGTLNAAPFDVVLCLEVVEHVPDVAACVQECARHLKPNGLIIFSTINRTIKAMALAIVAAEYILRWLPQGTHTYDKLVKPSELAAAVTAATLTVESITGIAYNPLLDKWAITSDTAVNYFLVAKKS